MLRFIQQNGLDAPPSYRFLVSMTQFRCVIEYGCLPPASSSAPFFLLPGILGVDIHHRASFIGVFPKLLERRSIVVSSVEGHPIWWSGFHGQKRNGRQLAEM